MIIMTTAISATLMRAEKTILWNPSKNLFVRKMVISTFQNQNSDYNVSNLEPRTCNGTQVKLKEPDKELFKDGNNITVR